MYRFLSHIIFLCFVPMAVLAQSFDNYKVSKAPFSTVKFDEFGPQIYNDGVVYVSNKNVSAFVAVKTYEGTNTFKIFFRNKNKRSDRFLSNNIVTGYNDGPVTFADNGNVIYFSSNLEALSPHKRNKSKKNRLGIFYSEYSGGTWSKIKAFRFNEEYFSVTMPAITADGTRLYFVSDKPGGFGGTDIYYSDWKNGFWDTPVNVGGTINTSGNETYPYITQAGDLFFSSDGRGGLGGKDIFYTSYVDSAWIVPEPLEAPINSKFDDFGITMAEDMSYGYFSSSRNKSSVDVFKFEAVHRQQFNSQPQIDDSYCYVFTDDGFVDYDTAFVTVGWNFGDSIVVLGDSVSYSFPDAGVYSVSENLYDRQTGKLVFNKSTWKAEVRKGEHPYIRCPDAVKVGDPVSFDAALTNMPNFEILGYSWDMGDNRRYEGETVTHTYDRPGRYRIKLSPVAKNRDTGKIILPSVYKEIIVGNTDVADSEATARANEAECRPFNDRDAILHLDVEYSVSNYLADNLVFKVNLLESPLKIMSTEEILSDIKKDFYVNESFNEEDSMYCYSLAEVADFRNAYLLLTNVIYNDMLSPVIVAEDITSDAEKAEFYNMKKVYSNSAGLYFQKRSVQFQPGGLIFFSQIAAFMNKYPDINILIESHTCESGTVYSNLVLSKRRANAVKTYLEGKGIDGMRIVTKGFGHVYDNVIPDNNKEVSSIKNSIDIFLITK